MNLASASLTSNTTVFNEIIQTLYHANMTAQIAYHINAFDETSELEVQSELMQKMLQSVRICS